MTIEKKSLKILISGVLINFLWLQAIRANENQTIFQRNPINQTESEKLSNFTHYQLIQQFQLNHDIFNPKHFELLHSFLFSPYEMNRNNYTISELLYFTQLLRFYTFTYSEEFLHSYSNQGEWRSDNSHGNQEVCLKQLEHLLGRANQQNKEKYDGRDFNFHQLLDTYGRTSPGVFLGSTKWPGMYNECKRLTIEIPDGSPVKTRYCLASFKPNRWQESGELLIRHVSLRVGVCLPRVCDSYNYKNKYELINQILQFNAREVDKNQATLVDLYCLPHAMFTAHLTQRSTSLIVILVLNSLWILLLSYSTFRFKSLEQSREIEGSEIMDQRKDKEKAIAGFHGSFEMQESVTVRPLNSRFDYKFFRSLSITNNLKVLFEGEKKKKEQQVAHKIIDLTILESLKVICMCYVIGGHVLMLLIQAMSNIREMTDLSYRNIPFVLTNMMPAFAVNSFFTITGILTTYLIFKNKESQSLVRDGRKWFAMIVYRYMRIMPMYVVVVAYTKYLAKYMGEGPYWDYATSPMSTRGNCEEESWLWTLLLGANFKPPLDHCIPSAWYLANDFQFLIVTPIFLAALNRESKFGKGFLKLGVVVGFLAGIFSILISDAYDLSSTLRFEPHGFKTYVTFLSHSYTRPQYRFPAYLCGMLIGFKLYEYEKRKLEYLEEKQNDEKIELEEPNWTDKEKKHFSAYIYLSAFCIIILPIISVNIYFGRFLSKIFLAFFSSLFHLLFSLTIGVYILIAATGGGNRSINRILSASFWKPLSRLSLCVVLINVEVVSYIIQTTTHPIYVDAKNHTALNIICILFSYLLSIVAYVMFESPLRELINLLLASMMSKPRQKSSQEQSSQ